ncbi:tyrosine phosphatase family-domain-containing protein [Blastocladiella britannica]|nr:tyrosine phosphatase family-domain-containing protein [Blastocladiella britannica]
MASTPIPGPAVGRASSSGAAAAAVAASPITTGAGAQTVAPIPPPAPYVVPDAFAPVEPGIYRSSIPGAPHVPFLRSLPVRTLVVLTPDLPSRQVAAWIEDAGIDLVHLGHQRALKPGTGGGLLSHATSSGSPSTAASASSAVQLLSQWRPCPEDLVKDALEIAMDPRRQPVLLACTTGLHETGCVVGCLRRMQHWNFTSIQAEYRAFADTKSRNAAEQMVELWDTDLVRVPDGCSVVGVVAL